MPHNTVVKKNVDLTKMPEIDNKNPLDSSSSLTMGDLHGNALKFIWILIHQGVMELQPHA